jgi:TRAP-type C4-dicarboxylate transport system substrate-binding protein
MNATRSYLSAALAVATATSLAAGCTSSASGEGGKPGVEAYAGEAITLTIGTDDSPGVPSADQISHFAAEVSKLSDGKITIEPRWHAEGDGHPTDWDQAVAAMVQDGELDLALGPTWAWDVLGVTSMQPLQTPFLVDSDQLVAEVITDAAIAQRLMAGLTDAGVIGISMWPEGLRHPFGFEKPLTSPDDYAGETIRSSKSDASTQLFRALGAKTSAKEPNATTMVGIQGEFVLIPNGMAVSNITFFPKVNLLYANADTYESLDDDAQQVLANAAASTQEWAVENTDDWAAGQAFCAEGGAVVMAPDHDVSALKAATKEAADDLAAAPGNAEVIAAIEKLKAELPAPLPADKCAGETLEKHKPGKAEARLNGTYRYTLERQEFLDAGLTESDILHNAGVQTFVLENGKVRYRLDPSEHVFNQDPAGPDETDGTYQVDGNIVTFWFPAYDNAIDRLIFEAADNGDLTMTAFDMSAGNVEFLMTAKVWEKIK